jgi:acetate kinase
MSQGEKEHGTTAPRRPGARLVTVNAGSSSVRLHVMEGGARAQRAVANHHGPPMRGDESATLRRLLEQHGGMIDAVVHRIVHPGLRLRGHRRIDAATLRAFRRAVPLAPLHLPDALAWIAAAQRLIPRVPQYAVLDTEFFEGLPSAAKVYALPAALSRRLSLRRVGFHGLAHTAMLRTWQARHGRQRLPRRLISLQLGAGCSAAAILDGKPVDTSMGMTPMEGLVMARRSGDIDPGILLYLARFARLSPEALARMLGEESGLLGLTGSADLRTILERRDPADRLALAIFVQRIRKYLGAYAAVLGGLDAVLVGGGIGEHSALVRAAIFEDLDWLGVRLDLRRNERASGFARISTASSRAAVFVVPVDEAVELARLGYALYAKDFKSREHRRHG